MIIPTGINNPLGEEEKAALLFIHNHMQIEDAKTGGATSYAKIMSNIQQAYSEAAGGNFSRSCKVLTENVVAERSFLREYLHQMRGFLSNCSEEDKKGTEDRIKAISSLIGKTESLIEANERKIVKFEDLPKEIIEQVLLQLYPHHMKAVSRANKFFASISNSSTLWRSIALRDIPEQAQKIGSLGVADLKKLIESLAWRLSAKEVNLLRFMAQHPKSRSSDSLTKEFLMACKAMEIGQSGALKSGHSMSHADDGSKAIDFLNRSVREGSEFREMCDYKKNSDEQQFSLYPCDPLTKIITKPYGWSDKDLDTDMPYPQDLAMEKEEVVDGFEALLKRIERSIGPFLHWLPPESPQKLNSYEERSINGMDMFHLSEQERDVLSFVSGHMKNQDADNRGATSYFETVKNIIECYNVLARPGDLLHFSSDVFKYLNENVVADNGFLRTYLDQSVAYFSNDCAEGERKSTQDRILVIRDLIHKTASLIKTRDRMERADEENRRQIAGIKQWQNQNPSGFNFDSQWLTK